MKLPLTILALLAFPCCRSVAAPNIVFIISDDHAWTDYGFMGHPQIETPHLDKLASRSALFSRGYVPTALCRPALATFASGLYAHDSKITGNDPAPDRRAEMIDRFYQHPALPGMLAGQGYLSHQSGKWWEGAPQRAGFTRAMTRGFPKPGGRHGDDGLTIGREGLDPVFEFIDHATAEKKPFLLWYAPFMPHTPHTPPDRLFKKYKAKGVTSERVARYYAMVEWFDETCGQLIDRIEQKGLSSNTVFVYVADNGWIQDPDRDGYAPRSKQSANEGGTRQPIMFCWPGVIQAGDRKEQLCSSIDIVPTLLAAAGARIPANLPGLNLLPGLKSGEPAPRKEVFGETFSHDVANIDKPEDTLLYRWIIDGPWKLLLTYDGKLGAYAKSHPRTEKRPQLFNLLDDPHEDVNLAAKNPEIVRRLAEKLQSWWPVTERQVLTTWTDAPGVWR